MDAFCCLFLLFFMYRGWQTFTKLLITYFRLLDMRNCQEWRVYWTIFWGEPGNGGGPGLKLFRSWNPIDVWLVKSLFNLTLPRFFVFQGTSFMLPFSPVVGQSDTDRRILNDQPRRHKDRGQVQQEWGSAKPLREGRTDQLILEWFLSWRMGPLYTAQPEIDQVQESSKFWSRTWLRLIATACLIPVIKRTDCPEKWVPWQLSNNLHQCMGRWTRR